MSYYIVCHNKRNNPRMDIRICQKKCDQKDICKEFIASSKILAQNSHVALTTLANQVEAQAV